MKIRSLLSFIVVGVALVNAIWHPGARTMRKMKRSVDGTASGGRNRGHSNFIQTIDHSNPKIGTFNQWYAYDTTYYLGPGAPIILFTPSEFNASYYEYYLTKRALPGALAKRVGGAVILLEHRYWGTSSPFPELTTANLKYLTPENSIFDIVNFARNVELPFDTNGSSNAQSAPWVIVGASYSGALTAWVESVAPRTIWAYQASSAVVEAIPDFWGYYRPVQQGMPRNCSKDVSLVIYYMGDVLTKGTDQEVHELKAIFGMESMEHNYDFMSALPIAPSTWQDNHFDPDFYSDFYTYFNETDPSKIPGAEGVGLHKALHGYAQWAKYAFVDYCKARFGYFPGGFNTECFDLHNASNPRFTDTSLSNSVYSSWIWFQCSWPAGWWPNGVPKDRPTIVSRLLDIDYWTRQCPLYFPPGPNGETYDKGTTEATINAYTKGWRKRTSSRLQYTNGQYDPWRESTVSAGLRPGGSLKSTPQVPVKVVPGGFHGSDLIMSNGKVNEACKEVQDAEIEQLVQWVNEWPAYKKSSV